MFHGDGHTHKTVNVWSIVIVLIDPLHLLKTIREGFANPRKFWVGA